MNSQLEKWQATGIMPYHTEQYTPFHVDYEYLRWVQPLLDQPLKKGRVTDDFEFFGTVQMEFDLTKGFPLMTTKRMPMKTIATELVWMLSGDTNIKYLNERKVKLWNEWADEKGDLGPIYGKQWRNWDAFQFVEAHHENTEWVPDEYKKYSIDQIQMLIDEIKRAPHSKGMLVSAWNPPDLTLKKVKLRSCHPFFQCSVSADEQYLNMKLYQRSGDFFLGVPFNIAQYALLLSLLSQVTGYKPGRLIVTEASAHIYENHTEQMKLQLTRGPRPLPRLELNPDIKDIFEFKPEDVKIIDYDPHPRITADITV